MENEKIYTIYTDASFDEETKLGTYAIVIMQENKIVKTISKRCRIKLQKSVECEVFAIYQAINLISSNLLNKDIVQKFWIRTDCAMAKNFYVQQTKKMKIFEQNLEMYELIKKVYARICKKLAKKGCSFRIRWIPRNLNKIAHKYSYSIFKKLKAVCESNDSLIIDKKSFIQILTKFNKKQCEIIIYLFNNSNQEKLILTTQKEISKNLNISVSTINKFFKELISLSILEKVKNGRYSLLI